MDIKKLTRLLTCVFFCVPFTLNATASADDYLSEDLPLRISIQEDYWVLHASGKFTITPTEQTHLNAGTPLEKVKLIEDTDEGDNDEKSYSSQLISDLNIEDKILKNIPFSKNLKSIWNVVDGETDIYLNGLRADRNNLGLSYTNNHIPFLGEIDGLEIKFSAGQENDISFKSNVIPFMGQLDGLTLKGSTNSKESKIFARYKVEFD